MKYFVFIALFIFGCTHQTTNELTKDDLIHHIGWMAHDKMGGRLAGSKEELKTAAKISKYFESAGLERVNHSYLQSFEFLVGGKPNADFAFSINNTNIQGVEFLRFSSSGSVVGNVVFAGNGVTEPQYDFDDYNSLKTENNVVILLAGNPNETNWPLRKKAMNAREHGASAVLFVAEKEHSIDAYVNIKQKMFDNVGIPTAIASFETLRNILSENQIDLLSIILNMKENPHKTHGFETNIQVEISVTMDSIKKTSHNVLGEYCPPNTLSDSYIILGAHMDHLGFGGPGSGSSAPNIHAVHNGADDNASGVSAMLEIVEFIGHTQPPLDCKLLFVAFGAEEQGLIGSSYLAENLPFDKDNLKAMINMDMIGRMENQTLVLGAVGTAMEWKTIITEITPYNLNIVFDDEGFGASDHQSFILEDIPSLFVFTGAHEDYHKPSDDIEKINLDGLLQVTEFVNELLFTISASEQPITFKKINPRMQKGKRSSIKLGTIPDYTYNGDGMRIKGVSSDSPAEQIGLQKNDVIISLGGVEIHSIYDYMFALQGVQVGEKTNIGIIRNHQKFNKQITPAKK